MAHDHAARADAHLRRGARRRVHRAAAAAHRRAGWCRRPISRSSTGGARRACSSAPTSRRRTRAGSSSCAWPSSSARSRDARASRDRGSAWPRASSTTRSGASCSRSCCRSCAGSASCPRELAFWVGHPLLAPVLITGTWVPIEALLIASIGTTPGKWLFGVFLQFSISDAYARRDTRAQLDRALRRSFRVWWEGIGCGFPLLAPVLIAVAYEKLAQNQETDWDFAQDVLVTHGPPGVLNTVTGVCGLAAMLWLYGVAWHQPMAESIAWARTTIAEAIPSANTITGGFAGGGGPHFRDCRIDPHRHAGVHPRPRFDRHACARVALRHRRRSARRRRSRRFVAGDARRRRSSPRRSRPDAADRHRARRRASPSARPRSRSSARKVRACFAPATGGARPSCARRGPSSSSRTRSRIAASGTALQAQGYHQDAINAFRKAKQYDPNDRHARCGDRPVAKGHRRRLPEPVSAIGPRTRYRSGYRKLGAALRRCAELKRRSPPLRDGSVARATAQRRFSRK